MKFHKNFIPKVKELQPEIEILAWAVLDGWMTCDFTSFSTVLQSYLNGGWMK